jgi:hydrogenase maturation protein HypF
MHEEGPVLDLLRRVESIAREERAKAGSAQVRRMTIVVHGAVQGVGFRPFIHRLATDMGLTGWVANSSQGVSIEAEGAEKTLGHFLSRVREEAPPHASIQGIDAALLDPVFYGDFTIRSSVESGGKRVRILPDLGTCPDCLREIFDPANRRYRYPFTNCTRCGPRFSIIESLPYDRSRTTMKDFALCPRCREEYESPADRRFHAQPTACPDCGPQLELWDSEGRILFKRDRALLAAAEGVREGKILAAKGLGGFHLIADARSDQPVERLRERKERPEKPFALMVPSIREIEEECALSELEVSLLSSQEAPIVLLARARSGSRLSGRIAPGNPLLGVMLPYTPLHHLLMRELRFPVVATSGNRTNEPICIDEQEAMDRLRGIADLFLVHNRPIRRPIDDSIVREMAGREMILRRARGYAPLPIRVKSEIPPILAVGGQLKNTVAIAVGGDPMIGQHVGDLGSEEALIAFQRSATDLPGLYGVSPLAVACDLHPEYLSTKQAEALNLSLVSVQHHHAHIVSCMAENGIDGPVLGVAWDGSGYGPDGTLWGGEFLLATERGFRRVGHLRPFPLPGGEKAIKEPRRAAIGLLYGLFGENAMAREDLAPIRSFSKTERAILIRMLDRNLNTPSTSSIGRLFDAVASLLDLRQTTSFEGQAAMGLEYALDGVHDEAAYPFGLEGFPFVIDWAPMIGNLLNDLKDGRSPGEISAKFHNTLAETVVLAARRVGNGRVVLSGGCFQNRYLTERVVRRLRSEGFFPYWHREVPPNDGGLSLGQLVIAAHSKQVARPLENSGEGAG